MRYTITILRHDSEEGHEGEPTTTTTVGVYQQSFDDLNVAETIARLNHVPVKRLRKAKAAK